MPLLPAHFREQLSFLGIQTNPRQVMNPNSSLTFPEDPFRLQAPKLEADVSVRIETCPKRYVVGVQAKQLCYSRQ